MGQHYVPQNYLKGFSDAEHPTMIWTSDKTIPLGVAVTPSHACSFRDQALQLPALIFYDPSNQGDTVTSVVSEYA